MTKKPVNWNTLILTLGFGVLGFIGKELYQEVKQTHDDVITIKVQMVDHRQYDVEMADVKSRIQAIEVQLQQIKKGP